jgi:hypothetical protein
MKRLIWFIPLLCTLAFAQTGSGFEFENSSGVLLLENGSILLLEAAPTAPSGLSGTAQISGTAIIK